MMTSATAFNIYQRRAVWRGVSPLIWRRVLVRSETTLAHLHAILQILFAWRDEHLHRFHIQGSEYGSSGAQTCRVLLRDWCLHRGERFWDVYDVGAHWAGDIRLEAVLLPGPRRVDPVCLGGQHAAPPEDGRGALADMERLEHHRRYPPLEAMGVVADAISTLWETDPHMSVREALGDLDALHAAGDGLEEYQAFQPDHCDRGIINKRLHAGGQEAGDVRCR
jgi:hypothetical protein